MRSLLLTCTQSPFRLLLTIPVLTQMVLMLWMATEGRPGSPFYVPDWLLHFLAYSVMTVLAWIAGHGAFPDKLLSAHMHIAMVIAIAFGLIDELLQKMSPVRNSDPIDFLADAAGAVSGYFLIRFYTRLRKETSP